MLLVVAITVISLGLGIRWFIIAFRRSRDRSERMAFTDYETGIANRRHGMLELEKAFAAARRGTKLSVILFDVDHLKRINEEHGRSAGDRVLSEFADILQGQSRAMNMVARLGGKEFIAILRDTDSSGAAIFANTVRTTVKEAARVSGAVTVSGGVAEYEVGMSSPEVLLAAADQALHRAKMQGGDQIVVLGEQGRGKKLRPGALERGYETDISKGQGELLLVVDDDSDARRSVTRILRRFGYTVLEARSPVQATEVARGLDEPVDLLLTDVVMPEMSGFRLVELMEAIQDRIRVLYMSGYQQEEVDWGGVPGEAHDFLSKPILIHELAGRVRQLLDAPRPSGPGEALRLKETPADDEDFLDETLGNSPSVQAEIVENSRILVLHSDIRQGEEVAALLRNYGYESATASRDPNGVFDALPHLRLKLVIVDLDLSETYVADLLHMLRQRPTTSPAVLILTGRRNLHLRRPAFELSVVDFLRKQFDDVELEARVRNLLRARSDGWSASSIPDDVRSLVAARTAELDESRDEVLQRLAWAAEYRDDVTGLHAERVGVLSGLLAQAVGWPQSRVDVIRQAAPLHDLGKIAIPDAILNKPDKLTNSEWDVMESHTTIGARILSGSRNPVLREAEVIALSHHEWWDGSGYPKGLSETQIPESGRLVAVADVFDSLTTERPYRDAISWDECIDAITTASGSHFDPGIVDALLHVLETKDVKQALDLEVVALPDGE